MPALLSRTQMLDLYFMDARSKVIEIAAFLDRMERAPGANDYRLEALRSALRQLEGNQAGRAERVLLAFSDPTSDPIARAPGKGASGAWPGPV
jgi:hypothetical protein